MLFLLFGGPKPTPFPCRVNCCLTDSRAAAKSSHASVSRATHRSFDLHATFLQLCSEVGKRGWTAKTSSPMGSAGVYSNDPIQETCYFTKTIGGREAALSIDRFANSVDGPLVALFIDGPEFGGVS